MTHIPNLKSMLEGTYYAYGATPEYASLSLSDYQEILTGDVRKIKHDVFLRYLVVAHEREHYTQYNSTPFGLLNWRIFQCLKVDTIKIAIQIDRTQNFQNIFIPIHEWARTRGQQHFANFPPKHSPFYSIFAQQGRGNEWIENEHKILEDCVKGIDLYLRFFDVLRGRLHGDLTEVVAISNSAMQQLAVRSGLSKTIHLRIPDNTIETPSFSTEEVLEAGARFSELLSLFLVDADRSFIDAWRLKYIQGVYAPVFNFLESELSVVSDERVRALICKGVVDLSLCAPIDHSCVSMHKDEVSLEDVHPGGRIFRLARSARKLWAGRRGNFDFSAFNEEICSEAKLPSAADTLQTAANGMIQLNANWGGGILHNKNPINTQDDLITQMLKNANMSPGADFVSLNEKIYRLMFMIRAQRPDLLAASATGELAFYPFIEFFTNACAWNPTDKFLNGFFGEEIATLLVDAFIHMMQQFVALSLLGFQTFEEVSRIDKLFQERIRLLQVNMEKPVYSVNDSIYDSIVKKYMPLSVEQLLLHSKN